jgi:hypothetical protein
MHALPRFGATLILAMGLVLGIAAPAAAHIVKQVGPYSVALGWLREPTYVGEANAVQVVIKNSKGEPISDLTADDLKVVISTGGQQSDTMSLAPTFDPDTGLGTPGDYEAPLIPTAPGDYTFHVTGSIHGTAIDETATSSETTFNSAIEPTGIQFPTKLPAVSDLSTRIQRVDSRVQAQLTAANEATATANDAKDAATRALIVAVGVGGLAVLVAAAALLIARRAGRARTT